ncbi:hypothetical protein BEWA_030120 [Theileria equi strain WA]|uniref:Uncharacterized protein n=1 Tax=Theileria equi strain WA TaxID=1537102 RepID=L0AX72_THEEQ|nr:hypothetical protein BEWA_030120 [Theileria equi strain WA]AFZ80160.1 hypothetical protein BEWA_030120 [Theileria equi strain WA]|eukprot:XP_004829826.1 hypothetical protein BEWA_030120 [Theileria equi strain WA]
MTNYINLGSFNTHFLMDSYPSSNENLAPLLTSLIESSLLFFKLPSQIKNKDLALQKLKLELVKLKQSDKLSEAQSRRRAQIQRAQRSERLKTYFFNTHQIINHRCGCKYGLSGFIRCKLDEVDCPHF